MPKPKNMDESSAITNSLGRFFLFFVSPCDVVISYTKNQAKKNIPIAEKIVAKEGNNDGLIGLK